MPDYPPAAPPSARPVTFYTGVPGAYSAAPAGAKLLATCPAGRSWEVRSIWVENSDPTLRFALTLIRLPFDYLGFGGTLYDATIKVFTSFVVKPGQYSFIPHAFLGLRAGDKFYGYQQQLASGGGAGLHLIIAGAET